MTSAEKVDHLERQLAVLERELAARLAGTPPPVRLLERVTWIVRVVVFVALFPSLVAVVASLPASVVADAIPLWAHVAAALGCLSVFLVILVWRAESKWRGLTYAALFFPCFLAGGLGADLPSVVNHRLDRSAAEVASVRVLSVTRSSDDGAPRASADLESWKTPGCTMRVVPRALPPAWRTGALVNVVVHRGMFGWTWIAADEVIGLGGHAP